MHRHSMHSSRWFLVAAALLITPPIVARAGGGTAYSGCGVLMHHIECGIVFQGDDGASFFVEELGRFTTGDHVFVHGDSVAICDASNPTWCAGIGCLVGNSIAACVPFEACGTIVAPPFCGLALAADTGGFWLLDDVGAFEPGDRVFVSGALADPCFTVPECEVGACVAVSTIAPCGQTFFSGCGQVVLSFTCGLAFAADDGSGIYVLDDFGDADVGTHLFVAGPIEAVCPAGQPFCACIHNDMAIACTPPGDLDLDGDVDGGDIGLMLGAWGFCAPTVIGCLGDLDFDGDIDGGDLGALLSGWSVGR